MPWLMRGLALGHLVWGLLLVLLAARATQSAFLVLGHMSTGTVWTHLPLAIASTLQHAMPLALLGAWMLILTVRLWACRHPVCTALLITHGILMVPGILGILMGIHALRAAEASAAKGGGLLGAWGLIPLGIGTCIVALALPSLIVALVMRRYGPRGADNRPEVQS